MAKQERKELDFDASIDVLKLDEEWLGHAKLFFHWSERAALARMRVKETKSEFEVVKAEVELAIREDPAKFDLGKITDAAVKAAIPVQPEYKEAYKAMLEAEYKADLIMAAVATLTERRRALENLVELHLNNYFAEPRAKPGSAVQMAEINKGVARRRVTRDAEED